MTKMAQLMKNVNAQCGQGTMFRGTDKRRDPPRLPTGVFSVDYSSGGGLPIWATTCTWGPEAGGKTSLALNTVKSAYELCWKCFNPSKYCICSTKAMRMGAAWLDSEGTLDEGWAERIGADPKEMYIVLADYGEQYANIAESSLRADDCGLLVIDSLAALTPASEMEADAEQDFIGLQARMITRLVRKLKQRLTRERKRDHPCAVLFTNQIRMRIMQGYGDPETMPGGKGLQHEFSLLFRCVKKALTETDKKKFFDTSRKFAVAQRHSFSIRKAKVLTLAGVGEYVRIRENIPELGLNSGDIDDYASVLNYAKTYGVIEKKGNVYMYFGKKAKRLVDIQTLWKKMPEEKLRTQLEIINRAKARLSK